MSIKKGSLYIAGGGSGSSRNIGDIFYTTRTDTALAGAVECNGGTYNTEDYEGADSIGELLEAGKLDYISLTDYATAISTKGWCDKIGWNGTGTTSFRVPTLTPHIIQTNNIPVVGNGIALGITDGTNNYGLEHLTNAVRLSGLTTLYGSNTGASGSGGSNPAGPIGIGITTDGTKSGIIADTSDTAQLRVMFQLFNSTTDEAVATVGTVVAQVGELRNMSNITATGKETIVGWGMPDYSAGVNIANNTNYTCPKDGMILATGYSNQSSASYVNRNGSEFLRGAYVTTNYMFCPFYFQVYKGDIINVCYTGNITGAGIKFYPLKGVN